MFCKMFAIRWHLVGALLLMALRCVQEEGVEKETRVWLERGRRMEGGYLDCSFTDFIVRA
jgi:hypothetical protein